MREAATPTRDSSVAPAVPNGATDGSDAVTSAAYDAAARLMESLLHDSRNPLNALAINLEVLTEKLKDDDGKVPESQDKNIRAMRDQIYKVDAILRQFSDFMTPRLGGRGEVNLSELLSRAVDVVGHESRRRRVKLKAAIEPNVTHPGLDVGSLQLLLMQVLLRALTRAEAGSEASVVLDRHGPEAVITVSDATADDREPMAKAPDAIRTLAAQQGARVQLSGGTIQLHFGPRP